MNEEIELIDDAYETFYSALEAARKEIQKLLRLDAMHLYKASPYYKRHVEGYTITVTEKKLLFFKEQKEVLVGAHEDDALDTKEIWPKFLTNYLSPQPIGYLQNIGQPAFQIYEGENPNAAFDSFAEFAKTIDIDENTDFLKAMAALDYLRKHEDLFPKEQHWHLEAKEIYFKFIDVSAPREINISFQACNAIKEAYNDVTDIEFSRRGANRANVQNIDITKTNRIKRTKTKNVMTKKNRKGKKFEKKEDNGVYWV